MVGLWSKKQAMLYKRHWQACLAQSLIKKNQRRNKQENRVREMACAYTDATKLLNTRGK